VARHGTRARLDLCGLRAFDLLETEGAQVSDFKLFRDGSAFLLTFEGVGVTETLA